MWACTRSRLRACASLLVLAAALATGFAGPAAAAKAKRSIPPRAEAATVPAPVPSPTPARFFSINAVLARLDRDRAGDGTVRVASTTAGDGVAALPPVGDEPFGLFTFRAPEGLLWAKQRRLATEIAAEAEVTAACRAAPAACRDQSARRFIALVEEARGLDGRARLQAVNTAVNAALDYTTDLAQHGVPDRWSAPLASFGSGRGDCEDYAIAKYVALREAGMPAEDLRILLVRDRGVGQDHAVLAARHDGHWLVLDNRWSALRQDGELGRLVPLFAIDHRGVSLFAAPYGGAPAAAAETTPATAAWGEPPVGGQSALPLLI